MSPRGRRTCKKCAADRKRKRYASSGSFFVRNVRLASGKLEGYVVHHYYDELHRPHSHSTGEKGPPAIIVHTRLDEPELEAVRIASLAAPRGSQLHAALSKIMSSVE